MKCLDCNSIFFFNEAGLCLQHSEPSKYDFDPVNKIRSRKLNCCGTNIDWEPFGTVEDIDY